MDYKQLLGDKWTQETEEALKKAVGAEFVSKADFNAVNEAKKKLEGDLAARDTELNAMKTQAGDGAALSVTLAQMKVDQEKAAKAHAAELESVRRDAAIEVALLTAKARNPKAAMALINSGAVKIEEGKLVGLDDQIKALKTSDAYLFEDAKPATQPLRGMAPPEGNASGTPPPQSLQDAVAAHFQKG